MGELTNFRSTVADSTNLEYTSYTKISPDDRHVYASGQRSDTLVYWDRDAATGDLTNQVNLKDKTNLEDIRGATVSPDGKFFFAMGVTSDSLVYWNRDADTGALRRCRTIKKSKKRKKIQKFMILYTCRAPIYKPRPVLDT